MGIFKKPKQVAKPQPVMTTAPETPESPGEQAFSAEVANQAPQVSPTIQHPAPVPVPVQPEPVQQPAPVQPEPQYREIPVCMSQEQINNLIIENNIMLKQIISEEE